jgi:hypothetical protein
MLANGFDASGIGTVICSIIAYSLALRDSIFTRLSAMGTDTNGTPGSAEPKVVVGMLRFTMPQA